MKKIIYLSLLLIIAVSCKKYSQDSSYSTYTPEGRLTKGSGWMCSMYKNEYGQEVKTTNGNFYLKFDNKLSIKYFDNTYTIIDPSLSKVTEKLVDWKFTDEKTKIEIESIGVFLVEKLIVDKMILKTTKGELYYFDKKPFDEQSIDKTFIGVPFLNLITGTILSHADYYNNCENLSLFTSKKYTKYKYDSNQYIYIEQDVNFENYIENNKNAIGYLDIDSKLDNKYEQVKTFDLSFSFNNTDGKYLTFNIYDLKSQSPKGNVWNGGFWFGPWLENSSNSFLKINGENYTAECLIEQDSVFVKNVYQTYNSNMKDYYTWKKIIVKNIPKGVIKIELNPEIRKCISWGQNGRGLVSSDFLISEIRTLK